MGSTEWSVEFHPDCEAWEAKVLEAPDAEARVREIEEELRLATALTAIRERAGLSQRELAQRLGVSQPRIAAIERSRNVTIDVLEQYVEALGARLEVSVVQGRRKTSLLGSARSTVRTRSGGGGRRFKTAALPGKERSTAARGGKRKALTEPKSTS